MTTKFTPRPYQQIIIEHMLTHNRCNVLAGMGMGKTSSTLATLDAMYASGIDDAPTLVLAPLRVAQSTWPDEVTKWDFNNVGIRSIIGNAEKRIEALRDKNSNVFTMNYENLPWLTETLGNKWPFKRIVADESTRLKSFRLRGGGVRAASLRSVAFKHVKYWNNLTGTFAPNGLLDVWGQNWFIDGGESLGRNFGAFKARWFDRIPISDQQIKFVPTPFAMEQIQSAIAPKTIALDPRDWFDIKEPILVNLEVDLPLKARRQYEELENEMFTQIFNEDIEAFNSSSLTMKCLQMASGAIYPEKGNERFIEVHDVKIQALESIVNEINGAPLLVAYHFKHDLARLLKAFPKGRALDSNPQTIRDWNAGSIPLLFAHPASAGHGLNLQDGGHHIAMFSHWWDLELYLQILERIGPTRQIQAGYDRNVFIYNIIARDTLDEVVIANRIGKKKVQDALQDYMRRRKK